MTNGLPIQEEALLSLDMAERSSDVHVMAALEQAIGKHVGAAALQACFYLDSHLRMRYVKVGYPRCCRTVQA